ncbi:6-phosphofructokinase [Tissierella creatinini]|nr:6-phosphofructokinase [Tissierella creatinini]TJX67376.1 6-phosphofructokinase [Soehngenia saccharolytica]
MKTIGILTSGGDAPGMNAALRAVVRMGIFNGIRVMGIKQGFEGLIEGYIDDMTLPSVADIIHRGGTILKTARSEAFMTEEGLNKALNVLDVFNIDGLVVLGGDGSFKGAKSLSNAGIPTIGIPCTIDNDLAYTDYTIGFFTAVETVVEAISKIRDTSSSHGRANIIEVMGRHCGDIALYAGLAGGAESIIVPEMDYNIDKICEKAMVGRNRGKLHNLIILAEGVGDPFEIAKTIEAKTGIETRVTVLGYLQRGGTPTTIDRIYASLMGKRAVELLMDNKSNRVLGIKCNKIIDLDIEEALNMEKAFDVDMYKTADILSL